ncbi:Gfo/Idh/MocA family protein [Halobacillus sp. Marseille-P3879]|uniref:Gfo/Idh/MocA family protein n=1 Tax=Halobacillus sp. Marseille-P3879 TaxID=2045014 RepID=UPI000C7E1A43|nr:Gfo/Idh/MocA family oxidoreductase [Halobacillus sp. Marseille-P3879]
MKTTCSIVLIGIAGYGEKYLEALQDQGRLSWVKGVVDIRPEQSSYFKTIMEKDIPVYSSLEDFYRAETADLAVISTPIHLHAQQAVIAMENGSHVLCEKPMAGSLEEAEQMRKVRDRTKRFLAVGFNWSFSRSVQKLKKDVQEGLFGQPICARTLVLWPRGEDYYQRSSWAGKLRGPNGEPIFDSIANNAASHFLHHLFYVLGEKEEQSAKIQSLNVELYCANSIETFDTCAVMARTEADVELLYLASHAINQESGPEFELEFEKAIIRYSNGGNIKATWEDGKEKSYGDPEFEHMHKLEVCIQAVLDGSRNIPCGIEASFSHLIAIKSIHKAVPEVPAFPIEYVKRSIEPTITYVPGLSETLRKCYKEKKMPSEIDPPWAQPGKNVNISADTYPY